MALTGYGRYIAEARDAIGMSVEALAERIDRKPSTVRRIEAEETEPSIAQVNALVAALPISAEELLRRMGAVLTPPAAARLPRSLVTALLELDAADLAAIERTARALSAYQPQVRADGRR